MKYWLNFCARTFDAPTDGGAGGGDAAAVAAAAAAAAAAGPWYKGKADDRIVGAWQNNFPQHVSDPAALAIAATTSWLEAQKALGVPADQILRVPTKDDDAAGWANVHKRLGRPDDAKDYVFKDAKGADLDPALTDFLRAAAHKANLSKSAAAQMASELVKFSETQTTNAQAEYDAKLAAGKTELAKNWGSNHAANMEVAKTGATALGVDREMVISLEQTFGYAKVMEMFRNVGSKTSEGKFVDPGKGGGNNGGGPMTLQQAIAKKDELFADQAWMARMAKNDRAAMRELEQIEHIMAASMAA